MQGFDSQDPLDAELGAKFEARALPLLPERLAPVRSDRLGAWLAGHIGVQNWQNDSFSVFHDADANETVAVWSLMLDRADDAGELADHLDRFMESRELTGRVEVDGRRLTWASSSKGRQVEITGWAPRAETHDAQEEAAAVTKGRAWTSPCPHARPF